MKLPFSPPDTLPPAEPKSYWTARDVFGGVQRPVRCMIHRKYDIGMHAHENLELNLVLHGEGAHYVSDRHFLTRAGDVFLIPPDLRHGYRGDGNLDVYHLLLNGRFMDRHRVELRSLPGYLSLFTVEPYFRAETKFRYRLHIEEDEMAQAVALLDIIRAHETDLDAHGVLMTESLALGLISLLCGLYAQRQTGALRSESAPASMRGIQAVMDLVEQRFEEKLTLADLAEAAHMQRNYFCRVFKKVTGVTPMEHLNQYRVSVGRRLLRETDKSVTEIATEVGFYDTAHFSRTFRRIVGTTPSHCRA